MASIFDKLLEFMCYVIGVDPYVLEIDLPDDEYVKELRACQSKK